MEGMFAVRTLAPTSSRELFPAMPLAQPTAHRPLTSRPAPPPASYAHLATRQYAYEFNQPLNFDTAKVTTMEGMFEVRALAPNLQPSGFPACG